MVEDISAEIVSPLLRRHRSGRAGILLVLYPGNRLPETLATRVAKKFADHEIMVRELILEQLAPNPVSRLVELKREGEGEIFSIDVQSETLLTLDGEKLVNALNLHRDSFRDQKLRAIFWIPEQHSRRFFDQALNFADYRTRLVEIDPADVEAITATETPVTIHNLPFAALGRAFKGRRKEMEQLVTGLESGGVAAISQPVGIQGLGGIGKTRLAVEYAWNHLVDYSHILFVRADTPAALSSNIAGLTDPRILDLPEQEVPDEASQYESVIQWLESHDRWLLIVDNADDESASEAVMELLPKLNHGAVIITSRYRRWGSQLARMDLDTLPPDEAVRFLLDQTRGERLQTHDDPNDAAELTRRLGYLPLALEQSAAHIRRNHLGFRGYLDLWNREREQVLAWHDESVMQYPQSIATTWSTSAANLSALARVILRALAWLSPDPVPISLLTENGVLLAEGLRILDLASKVNELSESRIMDAVDDLTSMSLLEPVGEVDFAMHRLIQQVERTNVDRTERSRWIGLGVRMVDAIMPDDTDDVRTWGVVEPLRPHALSVLSMAEEYIVAVDEATRLMSQLGVYFLEKALFVEAEPLMRRALAIDEASFGSEHPGVAIHLSNLALLLKDTNRLEEAEPLMRRALAIDEARFGSEHPKVAIHINNLALLLKDTNRLEEAEPLMRRALAIDEVSFGSKHPNVARNLNNLAQLLQDTNRLEEAEPLMRRALAIDEASFDSEHPNIARDLNNLAILLKDTNRLEEAEPLSRRAVEILVLFKLRSGHEHPHRPTALNNHKSILAAMGHDEVEQQAAVESLIESVKSRFRP